jgi:uncharacterized membrane protein
MHQSVSKIFLTGFFTILPVAATIYVVYWFFRVSEQYLGALLRWMLPERYYLPGMGLAVLVAAIFALGVLMRSGAARRLFQLLETLLYRLPLVKGIYGALNDVSEFLSEAGQGGRRFRRAVMVPLGDSGMEVLGFVTREDLTGTGMDSEPETVAVYLPMSFNIGGYTGLMSRDRLRPLDLSVRQGIEFALTAGLGRRGAGRGG